MKVDITVVKASHLIPFLDFLEASGAPVERLLNEVNLDRDSFSHPDNLVAEAPFWAFLELATIHKGIDDLGFQVTEKLSLDSYGVFGAKIMQANSLHKALTSFISDMGQQSNCPPFSLKEDEEGIWFCRLGTQGIKKGNWPVEQHVVSLMIQLVRGFTSSSWTPPYVHLQTHTLNGARNSNSLINTRIKINMPLTTIFIPKTLLDNAAVPVINQYKVNTDKTPIQITKNSREIIKEILLQSPFKQPYTAISTANALGMNVRKMQRLLKSEDTSFRKLNEEVLFEKSKELLNVETLSVIDISLELGYTDAANFTRSFKRWSGITPTAYRQYPQY